MANDLRGGDVAADVSASVRVRSPAKQGFDRVGLDLVCTQVAVELQSLDAEGFGEQFRSGLQRLTDASGIDAMFVALLDNAGTLDSVFAGRSTFSACNPEVLQGRSLEEFPWIRQQLGHLKLIEIKDSAQPTEAQAQDATQLAELKIAAVRAVGFEIRGEPGGILGICSSQPRPDWGASLSLALKLIGASCASGLERVRLSEALLIVQERDDLVTTTANDGLWDYDVRNNHLYFSPRWRTMLGYSDDDDVPEWRLLVHPDDMAKVQMQLREHLEGEKGMFESLHRMRHADGDWRWVHSRVQGKLDDNGRLRRLVGVETDVTERKLYEEALFREKESAQITLQSIGDGVVTTDDKARVQYLNPVAEDLTGWKLDDAVGSSIDEIFRGFHEETCEPVENPVTVSMRRNRSTKSVRPTLLIRRDELNNKLSFHASHDNLTHLVNRAEFEKRLERALRSAKAQEASYALLHLDLDQFKIVNDACGHSAGDEMLRQLSALLKSKIRWRDTLARLGGDEFGVLLESCTVEEAMRTAETLREVVNEFRFVWDDRTFRLGVSIGVVPILPETDDVASLISAADSACAAAKEGGRNRVYAYEETDIDLMRRRKEMQWAARINNALEENRFELFRQTIQPLQPGLDTGAHYELLLRMRDENNTIISPELFIAAAERYGITPNIDRWVISHAFRWLVSEADERERLALCSINLSGQSLADEKFLPFVIDQFRTSGLSGSRICFEIT
jgi:diguanylate cyclase (GGDEF)-like protein/PAS domain S-box-containing protein